MVTKMADQEQTVEPVPEPAVPEVAEPTENPAGSAENDENENQNAVTENQDTEGENQNTENEGQNADDETQNAETENKAEDENQIAETDNQNAENENENAENENPSAENENPNAESETPNAENENQNASPPEGEAGDDVPPAAAGEEGEKAAETEGTEQQQEGKPAEGEGAAEGAAAEAPGGDAPAAEGADGAEEQKADGEAPKEGEEGAQQPEGEGEEAAAGGEDGVQLTDIDEGAEAMDVPMILESEAFADGERPESPVIVGERLSRGGTPTEEEQEGLVPIPPGSPLPTTPDRVSAIGEEEDDQQEAEPQYEEEEYDEPEFDRDQLIEKYHQALAERQQLQEQNYQLQHKLADYFMKKKSEDTRQDMDKNVTDQEQRYLKYMANLDDLRRQDTEEREYFKGQIEELKDKCQDKQERVNDERFKFMEFKKEIALNSVNSRSGKPIPAKDVEVILSKENNKEAEVVTVRLENIKLKNKLKKKEMMLKSKEELAEGLHLIDFEQLKIENQTYNEKIEERNEELLKLRKKITSTVEVLTHLKEKLQFVQGENGILKGRLREVEDKAGKKRDILSRTKQARDALRIDNQKLRQNCGLLGNTALLRDFEERKDEGDDLRQKLDSLKMQHAELTLNLNGVRRKIEQAKVGTTNV